MKNAKRSYRQKVKDRQAAQAQARKERALRWTLRDARRRGDTEEYAETLKQLYPHLQKPVGWASKKTPRYRSPVDRAPRAVGL